MPAQQAECILEVRRLKKYFPMEKGFLRRVVGHVRAVDDVSFSIRAGETMGLVGESGCGKTTAARVILRALEPTEGSVLFRTGGGETVDLAALHKKELKAVRRHMQMIFQDPYSSLNPRMPILDLVAEPLRAHGWGRRQCEDRVAELLDFVGLDPQYMRRYPHAFSGGQRQRIGIARALALSPSLVIADEPLSALDVSIQAQILNLLEQMQQKMGLTYLFITHDLRVVRYICNRVAVMYVGKLVELADTEELFARPMHPYTSALLAAVPDLDPRQEWLGETLSGEVADPSKELVGCPFAPRCKYAAAICREETPALVDKAAEAGRAHHVACHRSQEIDLRPPLAGGHSR
jgi:peptide/nickel transport system ATP-binding protein